MTEAEWADMERLLPTPCYVVDEALIEENLKILKGVMDRTGARILLAQKAFSMYALYPLIGEYLCGATASGLYEARLCAEEMAKPLRARGRKVENHIFSPAYKEAEFREILRCCDHIVFNSWKQAERFGAKSEYAEVSRLNLRADPKVLETSEGTFYGKTVVLASGAAPRELGVAKEAELAGRGVAYCAACDGAFYRGKTVVVVGGGNSADALLLSRIAKNVILVHRRDTLRATRIYHQPLLSRENVEFRWNSTVTELLHHDHLTGVRLRDMITGAESTVECDGVFISVGRKPASDLVKDQLEVDRGGYIIADETTKTAIPGVYAVGDVRTKPLRQIATAIADGAAAVHMAEEYLAGGA